MNHSRQLNNRINSLHERAMRLVYKDFTSSFTQLLEKDNSVTIHQRNLQNLALEVFKVKNNLAPEVMKEVFVTKDSHYDLRNKTDFKLYKVRTVSYGTETISTLGPKIWNLLPSEIVTAPTYSIFHKRLKDFNLYTVVYLLF